LRLPADEEGSNQENKFKINKDILFFIWYNFIMNKEREKIRKEERDNLTIILEGLRSDFKMFGENLDMVREKGDATFEELGRVKLDVTTIKGEIVEIKGEIVEINNRLDNIEKEVMSIRQDFDFVKKELNQKVDINYIKNIEKRLKRVETHLELRT